MTGVIKAHAVTDLVTRFGSTMIDTPAELASVPLPSPLELALAAARTEIAELQAQISAERAVGKKAEQAARQAGEAAGRAAMEQAADGRLGVLTQAADAARIHWNERLAGLDGLAVMIARSALAKLVAESDDLGNLVTRQIALRIAALRRDSIVAIRVSTDDFADDAALAALAATVRSGAVEIVADPALAAGDCRIDLLLGHMDLGVRAQWRELDAFLAGLIAEETVR